MRYSNSITDRKYHDFFSRISQQKGNKPTTVFHYSGDAHKESLVNALTKNQVIRHSEL